MSDPEQHGPSGWIDTIPPPPRVVRARAPLRARWILGVVGAALLLPSALVALAFGALGVDLLPLKDDALDAEAARTTGTVVEVADSRLQIGEKSFDRVRYSFTPLDGGTVDGRSFAPAGRFAPGAPCEIEYLLQAPEISRVAGTRRNPLGIVWTVLVGFVLLPAAALCLYWFRGTRRAKLLLSTGTRTLARVVEHRPVTGVNPPQLRVTYEFDDALGRPAGGWQWVGRRSALGEHLERGGITAPVVYDEGDPTRSRLVQPDDFQR